VFRWILSTWNGEIPDNYSFHKQALISGLKAGVGKIKALSIRGIQNMGNYKFPGRIMVRLAPTIVLGFVVRKEDWG